MFDRRSCFASPPNLAVHDSLLWDSAQINECIRRPLLGSYKLTSTAELRTHTKAELAKMAGKFGITGASSMLKDDLVAAVAKAARAEKRKAATRSKPNGPKVAKAASKTKSRAAVSANGSTDKVSARSKSNRTVKASTKPKSAKKKPVTKPTSPRVLKRIRELQLEKETTKDIAGKQTLVRPPGATEAIWEKEPQRDRVSLFVRDAFWMHATWDVTRQAIDRARAAMAEHWHGAKPVLRLLRLDDGETTSSTSETIERDIEIHGGLRNWYIDWAGEPATFRVQIGYLATSGRFHAICESNVVSTPAAGTADDVDEHWSDMASDSEKVFSLSGGYSKTQDSADLKEMLEDRLHRELGAPALAKLGAGADSPFRRRTDFHFDMEVELVLYGSTVHDGYLTLNGEPVALREDGTFAMRLPFPDRRQVLPAVACSRDGGQQRTIVIAVERNTKIMEPLEKEKDIGE